MGFIASVKRRAANFYYPLKIKRRSMVCGKKIPYDETWIDKDVIIEDNVWLGNNVIILGGG